MPHSRFQRSKSSESTRFFGLRIESHLLQVAIATPLEGGRYRIEIDDVKCPSESCWLTPDGAPMLVDALAALVERHDMRRQRVAVSLDGDFCVTRVTMGTSDEVDRELATLADRVPRYLQLGPGEKVTGGSRIRIAPGIDYAVTGVVNRSIIQIVYDALRTADVDVPWVEPSLVGLARLVGEANIGDDHPVMIADGTGRLWDVGIICAGRLLLDYRPATATNAEGLREALDGHISRLRRFCSRHRGIVSGELTELLLCGSGEKIGRAVTLFGDSTGIESTVLQVPALDNLYEIEPSDRESHCVPAVATVLPLLLGVEEGDVADLLGEVRRAPDLPWHKRMLICGWPAAAAAIILSISYAMVSGERREAERFAVQRTQMETAFDATQARFTELSAARELVGYLRDIRVKTKEIDWDVLLGRITQSLPDAGKLNEFAIESEGVVRLDGSVIDEAVVYELVENLRLLPGVSQVALKGTSPEEENGGTRFLIRLTTITAPMTETGAAHE